MKTDLELRDRGRAAKHFLCQISSFRLYPSYFLPARDGGFAPGTHDLAHCYI